MAEEIRAQAEGKGKEGAKAYCGVAKSKEEADSWEEADS